MTTRFEEIKRLREEEKLGNAASRHLLAVSYLDDYVDVCMKAMLNSVCVAYYKLAKGILSKTECNYDDILESFRNEPGIKRIGEIESMILAKASCRSIDFQRQVCRSLQRVHASLASNILQIIMDKWGNDILDGDSIENIFSLYKSSGTLKTLLSSLNDFAGYVKGINFDSEARKLLCDNAEGGYGASKTLLDLLDHISSDDPEVCAIPEFNQTLPKTLIISLGKNREDYHSGRDVIYFEYDDLTTDILKDICFAFADYLEVDEVPLSIITDFTKENQAVYHDFLDNISQITECLVSEIITDQQVEFDFPIQYIDWLVYHNSPIFKTIGGALKSKDLAVRLNLSDSFDEHLKSKVRHLLSDILRDNPDVDSFSIVANQIKDSSFVRLVKSLRRDFKYVQWHNSECLYILANMYLAGDGVAKDITIGIGYLKEASDKGYSVAQYQLAWLHQYGVHVERDERKSLDLYTRAANQGYAPAQYELGKMYLSGEGMLNPDYDAAIVWINEADKNNYESATVTLAECYCDGIGVSADKHKYAELAKKLSTGSTNARALHLLADVNYNGIGVQMNKEKAIDFHIRAAELGDMKSQMFLGHLYENGIDVPVNHEKAIQWYKKAAEMNNPYAQYALAQIGHTIKDDSLCAEFIVKAIENGYERASEDEAIYLFPKRIRDTWSR